MRLRFLVVNRLILARLVPHLSQVRLAEPLLLRNLFGGFLLTPHFQNLLHPQSVDDGSGQSGDRQHDRSAVDASHTAAAKRWRVVDAMGRETGTGVFTTDA